MIFVNFKTYEQGTGDKSVELAKIIASVDTKVDIIPVVQAVDVAMVAEKVSVDVWTQFIDVTNDVGDTTAVVAENIAEAGAVGTFLNHSDFKVGDIEELQKLVKRAKESGLATLIFAEDLVELREVAELSPDYVSYEPPELIGSETTSVAKEEPELIASAAKIAKNAGLPLIVGAGIKSKTDVRTALKLGASGFAIASSIVKAKDPYEKIEELLEGYEL